MISRHLYKMFRYVAAVGLQLDTDPWLHLKMCKGAHVKTQPHRKGQEV